MDYEKKYKDALQRAKHALDCDRNNLVSTDIPLIYSIFPELKENDDERIRKELIELISCMHDADPRKKSWITWLEKQGNTLDANDVTKPHWISVEDEFPPRENEFHLSNYVLATDGETIHISFYDYDQECWVCFERWCFAKVTHWMPLPSVEHLRETTKMIEEGGK